MITDTFGIRKDGGTQAPIQPSWNRTAGDREPLTATFVEIPEWQHHRVLCWEDAVVQGAKTLFSKVASKCCWHVAALYGMRLHWEWGRLMGCSCHVICAQFAWELCHVDLTPPLSLQLSSLEVHGRTAPSFGVWFSAFTTFLGPRFPNWLRICQEMAQGGRHLCSFAGQGSLAPKVGY